MYSMSKINITIITLIIFNSLYGQDLSIQKVPNQSNYTSGQTIRLVSNINTLGKYYAQSISSIANKVNRYNSYYGTGCPFGKFKNGNIPFNIPYTTQNAVWEALSTAANNPNPVTVTLNLTCPNRIDTVYTLINTDYGSTSRSTLLKFNYVGGTSQSILMYGGNQFRDWNEYGGPNTCTSPNTSQLWSSDPSSTITGGGSSTSKRMDMQKIPISSANKLQSITIVDSGSDLSVQRIFLTGLSFHTIDTIKTEWRLGSPNGSLISTNDSIVINPTSSTTYYLVNQNGCYDSVKILIPTHGSIHSQDFRSSQMTVSLNPNSSNVKIGYTIHSKLENPAILISDMMGKTIQKMNLQNQIGDSFVELDLSAFENQILFLTFVSNNQVLEVKKLQLTK